MQNRISLERGTHLPTSEHSSSRLHLSSLRSSAAGLHGRFEKLPVKNRMHAASDGHVWTSQPWIVQYPDFDELSHWRSPFGEQSELMMHSSPISLPHAANTTIKNRPNRMSARILTVES